MGANLKGIKISDAILKQVPELKDGFTVKIGVASGSTYPNGQPIADVACWNEYGTPHIPARPFVAPTVFKNGDKWGSQFEYILKQSGFKLQPALEAFGNFIVNQVKMEINEVWEPPLSPYTVKIKGSDKPLIDTGFLMNSFVYQIEKK